MSRKKSRTAAGLSASRDAPPAPQYMPPDDPVLAELYELIWCKRMDRHNFHVTMPKLLDLVGFGRCAHSTAPKDIEYEIQRLGWDVKGGRARFARASIIAALGATPEPDINLGAAKTAALKAELLYGISKAFTTSRSFTFSRTPLHKTMDVQPEIFNATSGPFDLPTGCFLDTAVANTPFVRTLNARCVQDPRRHLPKEIKRRFLPTPTLRNRPPACLRRP